MEIRKSVMAERFEYILVLICYVLQLVNQIISFRRLPMRRARSTRKENLSLNGQYITKNWRENMNTSL